MSNKKETAEQFVTRMLTGLTVKTLPIYPDSVFYVDKDDRIILEIENQTAWVRYQDFWSVLEDVFKLKYSNIQPIIKRVLEKTLKTKGVTAIEEVINFFNQLEKTLKTKGVTAVEPAIEITTNERGFERGEFKDSVGHDCMIKQGGMQTNEGMGVWLGIQKPQITVFTDRGMANYVDIPTPENWQIGSLMYLSDKQIKQLIPMLQNFLKTGKLNKVSTSNKKAVKKLSAKTETKRVKKS